MDYLLDTHVLLWAQLEPEKLADTIAKIIVAPQHRKCISSVSIWEISLKYRLGKLRLNGLTPENFLQMTLAGGYELREPSALDIATSYQLPDITGHKDPFDRMLIWQAIRQSSVLLTADRKMPAYQLAGLRLA